MIENRCISYKRTVKVGFVHLKFYPLIRIVLNKVNSLVLVQEIPIFMKLNWTFQVYHKVKLVCLAIKRLFIQSVLVSLTATSTQMRFVFWIVIQLGLVKTWSCNVFNLFVEFSILWTVDHQRFQVVLKLQVTKFN